MKKHQLVRAKVKVQKEELMSGEIQDLILDELGKIMIRELYYSGYLKLETLKDIHNYKFDQDIYESSIVVIRHDDMNDLSDIVNKIPTIRVFEPQGPLVYNPTDFSTVVKKDVNLKDYI